MRQPDLYRDQFFFISSKGWEKCIIVLRYYADDLRRLIAVLEVHSAKFKFK